LDYFEKDGPSFLQREKYLDIINLIFKNMTRLERDAIIFQVRQDEHVKVTNIVPTEQEHPVANKKARHYVLC
jgi:hypothetical protein